MQNPGNVTDLGARKRLSDLNNTYGTAGPIQSGIDQYGKDLQAKTGIGNDETNRYKDDLKDVLSKPHEFKMPDGSLNPKHLKKIVNVMDARDTAELTDNDILKPSNFNLDSSAVTDPKDKEDMDRKYKVIETNYNDAISFVDNDIKNIRDMIKGI